MTPDKIIKNLPAVVIFIYIAVQLFLVGLAFVPGGALVTVIAMSYSTLPLFPALKWMAQHNLISSNEYIFDSLVGILTLVAVLLLHIIIIIIATNILRAYLIKRKERLSIEK